MSIDISVSNLIFRCCDNKSSSREVVENCVEKCNTGMKNAQRTLEKELGGLQVSSACGPL